MERIQIDIKRLLRKMDGNKMEAQRPVTIIKDDTIPERVPQGDSKSVNMVAIFLAITLIVIVIVLFIYAYNKKHNSTKEIINQKVKEDGKN